MDDFLRRLYSSRCGVSIGTREVHDPFEYHGQEVQKRPRRSLQVEPGEAARAGPPNRLRTIPPKLTLSTRYTGLLSSPIQRGLPAIGAAAITYQYRAGAVTGFGGRRAWL